MYYSNEIAKIYYTVVGQGDPLLIIHGFSIDHRSVKGIVEESLQNKAYKRIYIDLPGMGRSAAPRKMINANELLTVLIEFINDIIGKESFSLLGYSYGRYLALGIIKAIPDRVEKLILLAPVVKALFGKRRLPKRLEGEAAYFEVEDKTLFEEYKNNAVNITKKGYENYVSEIHSGLSVGDREFQKSFQKNGYSFGFEESLFGEVINCAALIILGEQDEVVGYKDMIENQKDFSKGVFILLENAGHNLQLDEREKVTNEINTFLELQ
ncbi:hypothetical protein A5821_000652 [Enterococcus sp. 7F3_DIV0205]|uniref:AB hydrolase-1 domain-containing protein n=1 Tax=Candidatus Enterococcus palustris TaxID=1834189 RepID=A0AAQ3Y704_9ENTE|nr:alpha/beta hydrolase [Enterococcus sp. 7F3_DIV0205]OTN85066.1 hypothetical protein A5821_000995 [Enterococcus sp. 7F3_DIV0205]